MRVLTIGNMFPPQHLGGYELIWWESVARMRREGHEIRALTTDYVRQPGAGEWAEDVHRHLRWYWRDHDFPKLAVSERLALERHNAATLRAHLRGFDPDAVCWWAMGGMSLALLDLVRRFGLPSVAAVCDEWISYAPRVDAWQRLARRLGPGGRLMAMCTGVPAPIDPCDAVDRWVFMSRLLLARAEAAGCHRDRATVATKGVDRRLFAPVEAAEWRWQLLYVGRIDRRKGISIAIDALTHLPEATLRIHGPGDHAHREELLAAIRQRGLAERVSFTESDRDQLPGVYAASDAVLFPVLWEEPWGLVPLEAMAVGRPVIATGRGGSGEYLRHGVNCLLFDADEGGAALAQQIHELARSEALRSRLVAGGLATVEGLPSDAFDLAVEGALREVVDASQRQEP